MSTPPYWVSYRSVVHRTDSKCGGRYAERYPWNQEHPMDFDRACRNCLPDGLPDRAARDQHDAEEDPMTKPCACGTDATSLNPAEVVVHRTDGPCYIAPATTTNPGAGA